MRTRETTTLTTLRERLRILRRDGAEFTLARVSAVSRASAPPFFPPSASSLCVLFVRLSSHAAGPLRDRNGVSRACAAKNTTSTGSSATRAYPSIVARTRVDDEGGGAGRARPSGFRSRLARVARAGRERWRCAASSASPSRSRRRMGRRRWWLRRMTGTPPRRRRRGRRGVGRRDRSTTHLRYRSRGARRARSRSEHLEGVGEEVIRSGVRASWGGGGTRGRYLCPPRRLARGRRGSRGTRGTRLARPRGRVPAGHVEMERARRPPGVSSPRDARRPRWGGTSGHPTSAYLSCFFKFWHRESQPRHDGASSARTNPRTGAPMATSAASLAWFARADVLRGGRRRSSRPRRVAVPAPAPPRWPPPSDDALLVIVECDKAS